VNLGEVIGLGEVPKSTKRFESGSNGFVDPLPRNALGEYSFPTAPAPSSGGTLLFPVAQPQPGGMTLRKTGLPRFFAIGSESE
jgi:hypothetical protein